MSNDPAHVENIDHSHYRSYPKTLGPPPRQTFQDFSFISGQIVELNLVMK